MKLDEYVNIIKLKKEKRYNEIYQKYGKNCYLNYTPYKYQKREINKLLQEGKFLEIYEKCGKKTYNKYLSKLRKIDIKNELGNKSKKYIIFESLKEKLRLVKRNTLIGFAYLSTVLTLFNVYVSNYIDDKINDNSIKYEKEIDDYNQEIEKYAEYINSLNLTDLEIIIKVMDDMWCNIDGYKTPSSDIDGYERLSLYIDGYGVCRNMADDFTARINAINPDYDACNFYVYISDVEINNIERNIIVENNTISENNLQAEQNNIDETGERTVGNHLVTCMKLKNNNALIIVDSTNPSIGLYKNGKIYMFSSKINGLDNRPMGNILFGTENRINYLKKWKDSYITNNNYDYLNDKYDIDSQNKVLIKLKENYTSDNYNIK